MRAAWLAASLAVLGTPANPATVPDDEFVQVVRPFLNTYCIRCHGPEKQKADRRFDLLAGVPSDGKGTVELWQDILDQLNLGEMPPEDTKNKPSVDEVRKVIAWATSGLGKAYAARTSTGGRTVLRRLNRQEYRHSVGELLALDPGIEDPTERFPPDERNHGFDNIGASLVMSDYLLVQYLEAAEALIDRALVEGPRPPSKKVRFRAPFHFDRAYDRLEKAGGYQNIQQNPIQDHGVLWLSKFRGGVPHSGRYTVRFKAEGVNRDYPYDEESLHVSKDQPLRIGILPGSRARGDLKERLGTDRHAAEFVLPEDGPKWFETTIWLDAGYQPRFTFPNGPNNWKHLRWVLVRKYPDRFRKLIDGYLTPYDWSHPEFVGADRREQWPERAAEILGPKGVDTHGAEVVEKWKKWVRLRKRGFNLVSTRKAWDQYSECYEGPLIRLYEVEIEGPHYDVWPPASHRAVLGELEPTLENAEAILRRFAERAFRRPVREGELDPVLRLVRARAEEGGRPLDALKAGLKAVLASPGFIYLEEGSGPLGDHALASRLSYFLWSSPPDAELRSIADRGALRTPETLRAQAERLLRDPRSGRLARSFTERWLELYKIGTMPPTVLQHPRYFTGRLESAMKKETRLYFRHLLEENLPVDRFLASDFTFVDGSLAHHYGIQGVIGPGFRKVALKDGRRGGLLGQASVLTASANGVDTSPVVRGVWVLENILGTPPSPPPADVEPLDPDTRGARTIRQQLAKHRTVPACNECHRKIDPLGFALENYGPTGLWRDRYSVFDQWGQRKAEAGPKVEAAGRMPDGKAFEEIRGLKSLLLRERRDSFTRCLTEKLLTYATGRRLEPGDRPRVNLILERFATTSRGLRDLIVEIILSDAFGEN